MRRLIYHAHTLWHLFTYFRFAVFFIDQNSYTPKFTEQTIHNEEENHLKRISFTRHVSLIIQLASTPSAENPTPRRFKNRLAAPRDYSGERGSLVIARPHQRYPSSSMSTGGNLTPCAELAYYPPGSEAERPRAGRYTPIFAFAPSLA